MRPYRGWTKDGKEVRGWYIKSRQRHFIFDSKHCAQFLGCFIQVIPETVGQFVCKDKNGKDVFADDQIKVWGEGADGEDFTIHKVVWCGDRDYPAFDLEPPIDTDCNGISYAMAVGRIELIEEKAE